MIRVILQGRTGNNLFQYAAGRALAIKHDTELILDGAWADDRHAVQFEQLLHLPIHARYERRFTMAKRLCKRVCNLHPAALHRGAVFTESPHFVDPAFHQLPDGSLLIGFFQSPQYFAAIRACLLRELDLTKVVVPSESLRFEQLLQSRPTVSLHVRRGDYVTISSTQCLGNDYHQRAIQYFRARMPGLRFCVFSDDIPWCREHFSGLEFLFCDLPGALANPLHDLRLMAACAHHIVVNSSYSWWGAWLNAKSDKTVIAPTMWMSQLPASQVVPADWLLI